MYGVCSVILGSAYYSERYDFDSSNFVLVFFWLTIYESPFIIHSFIHYSSIPNTNYILQSLSYNFYYYHFNHNNEHIILTGLDVFIINFERADTPDHFSLVTIFVPLEFFFLNLR